MEKLVLIDGNSLINRAFYAMPILSTKEGIFTNAVYGFMNMFFKMYQEIKPDYVAVAFDLKAPTFRHKMYSEYKGTRKPMPMELRPQIDLLKQVLTLMGVCCIQKEGIEADDIIGTIAKHTKIKTYIYTGDRDSFQLVDGETEVYFTKRGITDVDIMTIDNFKQKTGITPAQIIELKSLMGDSSDNIPGIPGVGEKTAYSMLEKYSDLDGVYAHLDDFTGKLKEKIQSGKDLAYLSHTLATIDTNCDIDTNVQNMRFSMPLSNEVKKEFVRLEFKSLYTREELFSRSDSVADDIKTQKIKSVNKIKVQDLSEIGQIKAEEISLVISENYVNLSDGDNEYGIAVRENILSEGFLLSEIIENLGCISDSGKTVIVYSKKDLKHLLFDTFNKELKANCQDVSILKYLFDYTGRDKGVKEIIVEYGKDESTPATSLFEIYKQLTEKMQTEQDKNLYYNLELPLADVLFDMEECGFKVDTTALYKVGEQYKEYLSNLESEIREIVGEPTLNINSPKQLGELIFEKLKLAKGKKNKTGYSTSAEILESLEDSHPVITKILNYRKIQKLQSTYIEGLKPLIDKQTGLIKTSFNQTVTTTGRLSSKEPNLQNIPVRDDEGKELRKFFVPRSNDRILISADYSQIELRLLASFSGCQGLIEAFRTGVDIHSATASKVFNVPSDKVTKQMRSNAKAVNFGIIYGISEYGLAKNLKISPKEAKNYIDSYFKEYPQVKEYMTNNIESAKKTGYAITMLGRKRYINELYSPNYNLRQFGERAAMNMPLQGSSADIIKLAMLGVSRKLKSENLKSDLILQVHDELIIDAFKDEAERVKDILVKEMENAVNLAVKLTVNVSEGENWFDAK